MFKKKEKRFVVYTESMGLGQSKIIMDRMTGVHYLFFSDGQAGGITPLLDKDGKPIVTGLLPEDEDDE